MVDGELWGSNKEGGGRVAVSLSDSSNDVFQFRGAINPLAKLFTYLKRLLSFDLSRSDLVLFTSYS